jgi:hypothetical protein
LTVKQEQLEDILAKIEAAVGTSWLEKWVHEIKELEFASTPVKSYRELAEKVPPLAVIWCLASDELIMIALTGLVKMTGILGAAYEIGINMHDCAHLEGFAEHLKLLKSRNQSIFLQRRYLQAIAAGYSRLGCQPLLTDQLSLKEKDTQINIICRVIEGNPNDQVKTDLSVICSEINLINKPAILYINIPREAGETGDLLTCYTKHIASLAAEYKNICQFILTSGYDTPGKNSPVYYSISTENINSTLKLPECFKPYLPG